jgi:histone H3/H4
MCTEVARLIRAAGAPPTAAELRAEEQAVAAAQNATSNALSSIGISVPRGG